MMYVLQRTFDPLACLNDKEREILGLLVAGHTVKSIATRLGRSEASINERLREARRKTGVGSSRELARLLDAQKNRDRKTDLASPTGSQDHSAQLPAAGRIKPKGMILMTIATILAAAIITLAQSDSVPATGPLADRQAAASSPLIGRWALDISGIPAAERPRSVTISFGTAADGQWTTKVEIVAPDGRMQTAESTGSLASVPVPITGNMDFIDTAALRQPEPGTLIMTLGKGGKPISTRVYTVSKDRRTMTETIIWAADGIPALPTNHFIRID
jgi:DNA-binding CsgD family transcriptional regulator